MEMNPLKQLYTDFLTILDKCVVKYKNDANKNEDLEIKKDADAFVIASQMKDTFETYHRYDKKILSEVLNTVEEDKIDYYNEHRSQIPFSVRDLLVKRQRAKIVSEYEEKNNYYRMLNGLPNYGDSVLEYVYVDDDIASEYSIPKDTPIHELDNISISVLDSIGYISKLIKKYPEKKYLKFLGNNKIDIVTARLGHNFSLLRVPGNISEAMRESFLFIYEQCREYFMSCIYIPEYRNTIGMYDNFIALCIMVMTIQQILARVVKTTVERNFFDEYCVQTLFSVYNVPYYKEMDSSTRQQIVQNLNILVQNKGTNKVLYDIASILGYDRLKIFKYYLMKVQKFTADGFPVVEYKEDPITGDQVYDYERMFDVYFQKVAIDDLDTYKTLIDKNNKVPYEEITSDDPFWVDDAELNKELYESEYNFVQTKYMGVSISYKLTRLLFENIYLLRLILDKKNEIPGVTISLPKISTYDTIPLFDAIVILCAMTCKQNGLKGEILVKPSMILHVMGFNFEKDFMAIQKEILDDPYLDDSLVEFFQDSTSYTAEGINRLYKNMLNLYDELVEGMCRAKSIEVYEAYKKLYYTMFYEDENEEIFNIGTEENPVYAKTFKEYIQHTQPEIYDLIESTEPGQLHMYINHICSKIKMMIPDLKYLGIFSDTSETMERMLVELIRFFKSYTTDMLGLDIIYIYDMKPELLLRFIEDIHIHKVIAPTDTLDLSYAESVEYTANIQARDRFKLYSSIGIIHGFYTLFDFNILFDKIEYIHANIVVNDKKFGMYDVVSELFDEITLPDKLFFKDLARVHDTLHLESYISFEDMCWLVIRMIVNDGFSLFDIISIKEQLECDDYMIFKDLLQIYTTLHLDDVLSFSEFISITVRETVFTNFGLIDVIAMISNMAKSDKLRLRDLYKMYVTLYSKDDLKFHEMLSIVVHELLLSDFTLIDIIEMIFKLHHRDSIFFEEFREIHSDISSDDTLHLLEILAIAIHEVVIDKFAMADVIGILTSFEETDMITIYDSYKEYSNIYSSDNLTFYQYTATTLMSTINDSLSLEGLLHILITDSHDEKMEIYESVHNNAFLPCIDMRCWDSYIGRIHNVNITAHDYTMVDLVDGESTTIDASNGLKLRETYKITYI